MNLQEQFYSIFYMLFIVFTKKFVVCIRLTFQSSSSICVYQYIFQISFELLYDAKHVIFYHAMH